MLPQIARGDSNKMWIIPSELTDALRGIGTALGGVPTTDGDPEPWVEPGPVQDAFPAAVLEDPRDALAKARGQVEAADAEADRHGAAESPEGPEGPAPTR